jgi:hypothetical protein
MRNILKHWNPYQLLTATSHTRLRARDQLHFKHSRWWKRRSQSKFASDYAWGTIWAYKWMQHGCKVYIDSYITSNGPCMSHYHLDYSQKLPLGGRPNTKPRNHGHISERSQLLVYSTLSCVRTCMNKNSLKLHLVEGPVTHDCHTTLEDRWPHYMILEVCWDDGLGTLSFGLSQFHGHGSWLVCEVAVT